MYISARTKPMQLRRSFSIAAAALGLGLVACGETGPRESDRESHRESDFMSVDGLMQNPQRADQELAAEALEATEVTEVITAIAEPIVGAAQGLGLNTKVDQAIDNTLDRFGPDCVKVTRKPGLEIANGMVTFEYANCTGPFKALSFSGTSTTTFQLDVGKRSISVITDDDLVIHTGGKDIPVVSSRSGTLSDQGLAVDAVYTGLKGEPRHITGLLQVSLDSAGCVVASLGGDETVQSNGFEVSNLQVCYDGSICVGGVDLMVRGLGVSLDFQSGTFTFVRPNEAPVNISVPANAPVCVKAW